MAKASQAYLTSGSVQHFQILILKLSTINFSERYVANIRNLSVHIM